jgi:GT2 family glycosyltransferase
VRLDIVVLQCGQSHLTTRLLASIYDTAPWARVILVDNGSPDGDLGEMHRKLRASDPLLCNDENLGFAKAVNRGIRRSDADYVCIQNNDTVMYPHGYERMIAHLEADPDIGLIGPMTDNADTDQRWSAEGPGGAGEGVEITDGLIAFFCTIIPRRVLDQVGPLSEDYGLGYGEDNDYCIRVRDAGYKLGIARDVFVHHDHHATYKALIGMEGIDRLSEENTGKLLARFGRV